MSNFNQPKLWQLQTHDLMKSPTDFKLTELTSVPKSLKNASMLLSTLAIPMPQVRRHGPRYAPTELSCGFDHAHMVSIQGQIG